MLGTHRTYQSQTAGILLVVLCAGGGLYSRGWTGAKKGRSLLIAGGGDLIRDDVGGKTFLYSLEKLLVAILVGKPVHLVNVGVGEPRTGLRRCLLRFPLRHCRSVIVRDTASLQLCLRYGAPATKLAHDIVFELPVLAGVQPGGQGRIALVCLLDDANVYGRFTLNDRRIATLASTLDHLIDGYSLP